MIEYENLRNLNQRFFHEFKEAFGTVLEKGWYILGEEVKAFEDEFARYCKVKHCVGVANGLDALTIALRSFSFPEGSEVIVPSNTYIATILAILNSNLKPVLVEPDIHTYNIDPDKIEEAISKKTVAIMVVHLYGKCCAMDRIARIAEKFDLRIIEDCAQAHGAKFRDKQVGTFGDYGAFSFYPTKNLGAIGDGGCITTDHDNLKRKVSLLRNYGSTTKYYNEVVGLNSRLDEVQAAFLRIKLRALDSINQHKNKLAALYHRGLKDDFIKPRVSEDYYDVYHIYNVRHPKRDELKNFLLKNEIKTEIHYPVAPHHQTALQEVLSGKEYPISEEIHASTLSLPISLFHSENDILKVVEIMNRF